MICPRCQYPDAREPSCARCGVIFSRISREPRPPRATPPRPRPAPAPASSPLVAAFSALAVFALLGAGVWWLLTRPITAPPSPEPAPAAAGVEPAPDAGFAGAPDPDPPPSLPPAAALPPIAAPQLAGSGVDPGDVEWADQLARRLDQRQAVTAQDVARLEQLRARYPGHSELATLLMGTLIRLGETEQRARRYVEADRWLERASGVDPGHTAPWSRLVTLRLSAGNFSGAEAAARRLLQLQPSDPDAHYALGYALFRQDREREALEVLRRARGIRSDAKVETLIARIEKGRADEAGFREQQLAHFNVRYDGSEHEAVGRAVLRALERHYATLVRTLDHRPSESIAVILFTREGYYDASGAPAWSGGVYDQIDGRIRLPVGGLTESLTPGMDDTLVHEVTHAFLHSMSRGAAPRVLHEGFAQYMEGDRLEKRLSRDQLKALAQGRASGVSGYYIEALGYVEFLIGQRGIGGIKQLLEAMAATGSADTAFRQVYRRGASEVEQDWRDWMKRRYGR